MRTQQCQHLRGRALAPDTLLTGTTVVISTLSAICAPSQRTRLFHFAGYSARVCSRADPVKDVAASMRGEKTRLRMVLLGYLWLMSGHVREHTVRKS
jgi:hypothetical protein